MVKRIRTDPLSRKAFSISSLNFQGFSSAISEYSLYSTMFPEIISSLDFQLNLFLPTRWPVSVSRRSSSNAVRPGTSDFISRASPEGRSDSHRSLTGSHSALPTPEAQLRTSALAPPEANSPQRGGGSAAPGTLWTAERRFPRAKPGWQSRWSHPRSRAAQPQTREDAQGVTAPARRPPPSGGQNP